MHLPKGPFHMLVESIAMANAEVSLYREVFSAGTHDQLFQSLLPDIAWQQHRITV